MMEHEYLHGRAFVKKSKGKIQIFETPYGLGDFVPVVAEGTTKPRMLKDRFADVVNVKDFGAVGDGVHDDTDAFTKAAKTGAIVYVPRGVYVVTSPVHGNFVGDVGSHFTDYKVYVKRQDSATTRYMKRPVVGVRLIWEELKAYSQTRFTPQALAVFEDLLWLRMTPNEENPADSRAWVGVFDMRTGKKLSIFSTGAANPLQPIDQGLRVYRDGDDGKRKLVCRYYEATQISDGLAVYDVSEIPADASETVPLATHPNLNLGYDWFYGDGFYYVQQHSAPDGVKYDKSVFAKYDANFKRVGILVFSAGDALRVKNPYKPTVGETIADVSTKTQSWAVKDGLIYAACGAAYGEIPGVLSAYQGLKTFSTTGDRVDSALCDPAKCLAKITSVLPDTVSLIEAEGLAVDEHGIMYSLQQTVSNSVMNATDRNYWIFEECSQAVDAIDFSNTAAIDASVNIDRFSIGAFPMLGKTSQTLVNPWTGEDFTSISQVLDYMVFSGQKVLCINCQQAVLNDLDGKPFPSGMLIMLELLNSLTVQCSIKHTPTDFLLKNTSSFRYRKEGVSWKKIPDRSTGIQNAVLGANIDSSKDVLGDISFPDSSRTKLIKAVQVLTSSSINKVTFGGTSATDSPNRMLFGIDNEDRSYSSIQFAVKAFRPVQDGDVSLGSASGKWSNVYASTGSINTSDERAKQNIVEPEESLMSAWSKVNFKVFQFKDAVEKKGADARLHVGVIAQQVIEAFASEGLDATRYGLLCYDKWDDEYEDVEVVDAPEIVAEDGTVTHAQTHIERRLVTPAGDRYGIRYEEALALEAAYQRWRMDKLEAALIEKGVKL